MKTEALLKSINADLDMVQTLMKSYQEKSLEKAGEFPPASPGEEPPAPAADPAGSAPGGWSPEGSSNEELLQMLEELMQIIEQRLGGGAGEGGAPADAPAPAAPGAEGGQPLAQAEGEPDDEGSAAPQMGEGSMEPEAGESAAHEGGESPQMEAAEGEGAMDPADPAAAGGEGEIEMDESPEQLQQEIAALSPEDFQKLKAAVDAIANGGGGGGEQPPAPPAAGEPVQKAVVPFAKALPKVSGLKPKASGAHDGSKPQASNLLKSMAQLCDGLEKLGQKLREPSGMPQTQYADSGVRVLEKSQSGGEAPMDGSTLADWLLTEQRKGNKLVKSLHVAAANCAKSPESLAQVYGDLRKAGIALPS
jgi:hypothetical protein